ncbi:MAG: hypothetical protein U0324_38845 [Polyangiales bacterium]
MRDELSPATRRLFERVQRAGADVPFDADALLAELKVDVGLTRPPSSPATASPQSPRPPARVAPPMKGAVLPFALKVGLATVLLVAAGFFALRGRPPARPVAETRPAPTHALVPATPPAPAYEAAAPRAPSLPSPTEVARVARVAPVSRAPARPPRRAPSASPTPAAPPAAAPEAPLAPPVAPTPAVQPAEPPPDDPLARELDLIQRAEAALRAGDALGARALLRRYASEHPRGEMRPEALGVDLRALCALGDREEAARVAARLQALAPRSTPARRIPTTCVGDLREPTSEEPR